MFNDFHEKMCIICGHKKLRDAVLGNTEIVDSKFGISGKELGRLKKMVAFFQEGNIDGPTMSICK